MDKLYTTSTAQIALVNMPWARLDCGSLALGLLKSILRDSGIGCDVFYMNLLMSKHVGDTLYDNFTDRILIPEYFFSPYYYEETCDSEEVRNMAASFGEPDMYESVMNCIYAVPGYIDKCLSMVNWQQYSVIGFTINFSQLLSSLCLAKAIKASAPDTFIIFGGSGCDGAMGREVVKSFGEVDFVFQGEAEYSIVPFVEAVLSGSMSFEDIGGICYLKDGEPYSTSKPPSMVDLNKNPYPDYTNFFQQKHFFGVETDWEMVYLESSRGCWWGEKKACKFCGLNQLQMTYRSKSQQRFLDEIDYYAGELGLYNFYVADNILDMKYFELVIPQMMEMRKKYPLTFNYEIKSNLTRSQVKQLSQAGVKMVQPGVESLNDHILSLMSKGARGKHSIQIVKYCTEEGMDLQYNILYGFPGEKAEDYDQMNDLIPYIRHLVPPGSVMPIMLARFSIYFDSAKQYDITSIRPLEAYHHIFGKGPSVNLDDLAYHFTFEHKTDLEDSLTASRKRFRRTLQDWQDNYRANTLVYDVVDSHEIIVFDSRDRRSALIKLDMEMSELVLNCLEFISLAKLRKRLQHIPEERLLQIIEEFIAKRWMYKTGKDECIFLPVRRFFYAEMKKHQIRDNVEVEGIGVSQ